LAIIGAVAAGASDDDGTKTASESETTTEPEPDPATTDAPATTETPTTETPTTTAPEGPLTLAMGETLSFTVSDFGTDAETNIDAVVANPITANREPAEYGMEPTRGLFLVVDVSVKARADSEGTYLASPYEFKFVAKDGTVVESGYVGEGFGPELPTTELAAGQQIAGKVGFDIAPGQEAGGRIQINDSGENYGEPFAFWTL
jgi:Domain of unknown function (DUF4352)